MLNKQLLALLFLFPKARSTYSPSGFGNWINIAKACSLNGSLPHSVTWEAHSQQCEPEEPQNCDALGGPGWPDVEADVGGLNERRRPHAAQEHRLSFTALEQGCRQAQSQAGQGRLPPKGSPSQPSLLCSQRLPQVREQQQWHRLQMAAVETCMRSFPHIYLSAHKAPLKELSRWARI